MLEALALPSPAPSPYSLHEACALDGDTREGLTFWLQVRIVDHTDDLVAEVECQVDHNSGCVETARLLTLVWPRSGWRHNVPDALQDVDLSDQLMHWLQTNSEAMRLADAVYEAWRDEYRPESSMWRNEP